MRRELDARGDVTGLDVVVEHNHRIAARDGTELMTDLFRPVIDGHVVDVPLPVLLCRTPYGRARWSEEGRLLASHGYVVAIQDWRQTQGDVDAGQYRPKHEARSAWLCGCGIHLLMARLLATDPEVRRTLDDAYGYPER